MLSYEKYTEINEAVRSELFKNGMVVEYSKDGRKTEYYKYLCLTEEEDIEKVLDKLKWSSLFNTSDKQDMLKDKYGIFVTSRENGAEYVLISRVIVNNILYIWDAELKLDDCIKDDRIKSLDKACDGKKLIYEKDVDIKNIVTTLPDKPYYNSGFDHTDGHTACIIDHSVDNLGII